MLRILVVSSDAFPPRRVDMAVLFGEELAGRGHRIDYILQSEGPCPKAYLTQWGGGTVWVGATNTGTSLVSRIDKHLRGIANDLRIFGRLRSGNYDIVAVKDKFLSGVLALLAARIYRRRFVYWLSYPFAEESLLKAGDGTARYPLLYRIRGHAFKLLLYRLLLPAADLVFVQSEQMRSDIAREGIAPAKMVAVPMGIKPERFELSAGTGYPAPAVRSPSFLYLGTLNRVRHLDFLVRVLARLRNIFPDAMLYVVGGADDPGEERLLVDEAARLGVGDGLVMVGQLPQAEALRYVRAADVCVSPFFPNPILNSTSPTKLVEYMAMGKAVVANDHPEQRLVIEQSAAGYCVGWDEAEFAGAICRLFNDPAEAARMGDRGRRYVLENRSYARIADLVEAAFQRLGGSR